VLPVWENAEPSSYADGQILDLGPDSFEGEVELARSTA
jgi:hypothetical protein